MQTHLKPKRLTYLGALPFLLALLVACYGHFNLNEIFGYQLRFARFKSYMLAHTYGAVIVAFLAGIQWGVTLNPTASKKYYIISNVIALMAWFSLFAFASIIGIVVITVAFILALLVDYDAFKAGMIPEWFWQLRVKISAVVILSLLALILINW